MASSTRFAVMVAQASARMPIDLKEALRLAAQANEVSMSKVIRDALETKCASLIRQLDKQVGGAGESRTLLRRRRRALNGLR